MVDFTFPFYEDEIGVAVREVLDDSYISASFHPFHVWVWLLWLLAMFGVGMILWLVAGIASKVTGEGDPLSDSYWRGVWYCFTSFLTQSEYCS